ncbi:16S rRNA (cytosine967-C5)-methyltransferase [Natranaerovirga pectinivora]|uniref:16S rRNA (cytosine(967)-C(5))-methyltransferase n=1 Tax=Natranaerovirga pectinivora TaxID=682400 RepID=A0A4R3MNU1_9FIRM|nr:16S rRNA (cytosine(967)-C(5))-methyltransferase RsmB [Natranaerovirga pectinivora]TCT16945.1 16S rRNA (cytosine967-C5)-methyltransferase [Natranaerovirga pectinivora]
MTNQSQVNLRLMALSVLDEIIKDNRFSHKVLNQVLKNHQELKKQERAFITRLVEGTLENLIYLDYVINQFSKTKTSKMKTTICNILRLSVYQLMFMESVPDSAVCNEAVKLAKKRGFVKLSGFVNGVLRNIARSIDNISLPSEEKNPIEYLSVLYSFPEWIIKIWLEEYEYEVVKEICIASNSIPETTIRCNKTKISPTELKERLVKEGVNVKEGQFLDYGFNISNYDYLGKLDTFNKGYFQVQDESSMLVGEVADPKKGDLVIDVCAAPGGKSTHIAELCGECHVVSRDLTYDKTELINENVRRLNLTNIKVEKFDALELDENLIGKADIILADLPCSGLGIIRKKPDIKYNANENQITSLIELQRNILKVIQEYLKPGGILVFSTCTINKRENEDNVKWLIENLNFEIEDARAFLPEVLRDERHKGCIQILPHQFNTDGFFIARLRKL